MPEKEGGAQLDWEGGKADGVLFTHPYLALGVCGSGHRISSLAPEKAAPLPYLLHQQYRNGGHSGVGVAWAGRFMALSSQKRSQAHREAETVSRGHTAMKDMAGVLARSARLGSLPLQLLLLWPSLF